MEALVWGPGPGREAAVRALQAAGLKIITWTTERSGRIVEEVIEGGGSSYYYQSTLPALENDGDILYAVAHMRERDKFDAGDPVDSAAAGCC